MDMSRAFVKEDGDGAPEVRYDLPDPSSPHFDEAAHDNVAEEYEERGDLSPSLLQKMFVANAERTFAFDAATVEPAL